MLEPREDPLTGEVFQPTRFNQKFACRKNQIAYNNRKARIKRHKKKAVDRALDKNRDILQRILGDNDSFVVSRDYLLGAGFNFRFFSGVFHKDDLEYYSVYEYCVSRSGKDFKIERI